MQIKRVLSLVVATLAVTACGSSAKTQSESNVDAHHVTTHHELPVALHLTTGSYMTTAKDAIVSGNTTPGAKVTVNGQPAAVSPAGRWHRRLSLLLGPNDVEIHASLTAHKSAEARITITRHRTAAERATILQKQRERREAHERHLAEARERREEARRIQVEEREAEEAADTDEVGSASHAGDARFCEEHECIGEFTTEPGVVAECADGTYTHSGGIQGACSDHGGVVRE
ncbi:MAG TPA: hypothetical protein VGF95_07175 [Solirubrobacteraceae bacterium]|jgi:hypothetical protein